MRPTRTVLAATCLSLVLAGCGQDEQEAISDTSGGAASGDAPAEQERAEWSYEGDTGPEEWAELQADYATCGSGQEQSPIDLTPVQAGAEGEALPPVTFDYEPATYELENLGHTVQASVQGAGAMMIGDERFELLQFHAHVPSEHALDGQRSALEVHLVHQDDQDELAVLGLLVDEGSSSSALSEAWAEVPGQEGEAVELTDFDVSSLIPADPDLYRYEGSLTTPPCTEGVQWLVVGEPVDAPAEIVDEMEELLGDTARPLQPVGSREVGFSGS